jgi:hypothetical protein
MTDVAMRAWVAECQWEGRQIFRVGTFFLPKAEGYEAARNKARDEAVKFFSETLPTNVPPPDSIKPIPGLIYFVPEESDD